jgi:hypothetical protein
MRLSKSILNKMIDIGANLTNERYAKDLADVVVRAQNAGCGIVLLVLNYWFTHLQTYSTLSLPART